MVTHPNCPPSFIRIRPQLFEMWCYMSFLSPISQRWRIIYKFSLLDPDPDLHQTLISSSMSHTEPVHKISAGSVHNFLRYPAHRQTDKQTRRRCRAEHDTCKIHKTNLTLKIIGDWIQWPNMQLLFKFQVNWMKIDNFRNSACVDWPFGRCWPQK